VYFKEIKKIGDDCILSPEELRNETRMSVAQSLHILILTHRVALINNTRLEISFETVNDVIIAQDLLTAKNWNVKVHDDDLLITIWV